MMPVLTQSAKTPHEALYGMFHHEVYVVRSGPWKLHLKTQTHTPDYMDENWVDPRGPDGVTILGPCAQPLSDQFPGLLTGDSPQSNMLFNLETDPGEQRNVADEHPKVVRKLTKMYNEIMSRVDAKQ